MGELHSFEAVHCMFHLLAVINIFVGLFLFSAINELDKTFFSGRQYALFMWIHLALTALLFPILTKENAEWMANHRNWRHLKSLCLHKLLSFFKEKTEQKRMKTQINPQRQQKRPSKLWKCSNASKNTTQILLFLWQWCFFFLSFFSFSVSIWTKD